MRIALLNTDSNNKYRQKFNKMGGVGYYRLWLPKIGLEKITDWEIDFIGTEFGKDFNTTNDDTTLRGYVDFFNQYDLVILKHFDNPNAGRFIMAASDYTGVPYITDLDDDVLSVREDQPASKLGYNKGEVQRVTVGTMLSFSKALFVTNDFLGKNIQTMLKDMCKKEVPYFVLPNSNNAEEWAKYKSKKPKGKTVIGWHGSITHNSDLEMVLPVIERIMKEDDSVYLELMGGVTSEYAIKTFKEWDLKLFNRVKLFSGTQAWDKFPYTLMKQKWTIGIAPLIDDQFNRSKSNIKWLEYTMKHIPTVASNVEPYRSITDGVTGLLCDTPDDWYNKLTTLIKDTKLKDKLAKNAYKEVLKKWQYTTRAKDYKKAIDSVLK
jgi:glycosyltransferase involved in cell wall biosynthesis